MNRIPVVLDINSIKIKEEYLLKSNGDVCFHDIRRYYQLGGEKQQLFLVSEGEEVFLKNEKEYLIILKELGEKKVLAHMNYHDLDEVKYLEKKGRVTIVDISTYLNEQHKKEMKGTINVIFFKRRIPLVKLDKIMNVLTSFSRIDNVSYDKEMSCIQYNLKLSRGMEDSAKIGDYNSVLNEVNSYETINTINGYYYTFTTRNKT